MATGYIEDAILGAVAGQLLKSVLDAKSKAFRFKSSLSKLESTLKSLIPKINEIERINRDIDFLQKDDIREFILLLQKGEELVEKCLKVSRWNYSKKYRYSKKLLEMDASLCRFAQLNLLVDMSKDMKKIFVLIKEMNDKLDRLTLGERNGSGRMSN